MSDDKDSREPTRLEKLMDQLTFKEQVAQLGKEMQHKATMTDENQPRAPAGKKQDWEAGNREHRRVLPAEQGKGISPATSQQVAAEQTSQITAKTPAPAQTTAAETLERLKSEVTQYAAREAAQKQEREAGKKQQREAKPKAEEPQREAPQPRKGGRGR